MRVVLTIALVGCLASPAVAQYEGHRQDYRVTPGCPRGACPQFPTTPVPPPASVPEPYAYESDPPRGSYAAPGRYHYDVGRLRRGENVPTVYSDDLSGEEMIDMLEKILRRLKRAYVEERGRRPMYYYPEK